MTAEKRKLKLSDVWSEARQLVWARRYRLLLGLLLISVNRLAGMVLPASSKYLVDEIIGKQQVQLLSWLALWVGLATVVNVVTSYALSMVLSIAAQRSITEMRKRVQTHVTRLPVSYFDATQSGVLVSRVMNDAEGIRNLVGTGLVQLAGGILTAGVALCVLFYLNWKLTSLTLVVLAAFALMMAFAFKTLRPVFRERGKITAEVTGRLSQSLGGIRVVKAYVAEERENRVFAGGVERLFSNVAITIRGVSAVTAFSTLIIGIIGIIIILFGGKAVLSGSMTLGDLVMYVLFTGLVAAPVVQIASVGTQLSEAFAGLDRIRELLSQKTEMAGNLEKLPAEGIKGEIAFHDVSFEYQEGVPVLEGVTFKAAPGSTTALVGPSGAGKSTLTGLVMAFSKPTKGTITVDGKDLQTIRLQDYRKSLGVVLQDNFLFDGTIAENIAYASPEAPPEAVISAARTAHCEEFIEGFRDGYETVVGERGVKLSGGQRQRVAIARAILSNPRILILDEATSSLDSDSEAMIQDGLRSLRQGRTTFVIAHRLSTIVAADQILVLDDGRIVERGTHHELLQQKGLYTHLYEKQFRIEQDRFINPGEETEKRRETPEYGEEVLEPGAPFDVSRHRL